MSVNVSVVDSSAVSDGVTIVVHLWNLKFHPWIERK